MIEKYIKVLESFKEHQISKLIEKINEKVLTALNSPKFNRLIAPYLKNMNTEGVPFTDFEEDPDNISQIKKLINAMYHGRLAFLDLENIDLRKLRRTGFDLWHLYSNTIHEAYQASYLLTHLDVDLRGIFDDEINILLPIVKQFESLSKRVATGKDHIAEKLKSYPLSYNVGLVGGIAIDQMKPSTGDIDFNFLTQFSAVLPSYLQQFSKYLSQYSSEIIEKESTLNKAKLLELQNAAYTVLNNLDKLQEKSFFAPLKFLNYIHIVRHTITLSMSILEQIGNVSGSSQDVIRDKLALLKYSVLPTLFGLVDKIEDNIMLKPGTLSAPLMAQVKPLYELLIYYAAKPVDFYAKGEELLGIEDSRFIALRLELTYKRIKNANKSLFKIQKAQDALDLFFKILEDPNYKNFTIRQLPIEVKKELIIHYKLIKPYMGQIDVDLDTALIDGLQNPEPWSGYFNRPFRKATGIVPADHLSLIIKQKGKVQSLITKNKKSQEFHIKLNEDLIDSVHKKSNLTLFPFSGDNAFLIDESAAFHTDQAAITFENGLIVDTSLSKLKSEQALDIYQWYRNKHDKFMIAGKAYHDFVDLLEQAAKKRNNTKSDKFLLNTLDAETLAECRNLYNLIQPYFTSGVTTSENKEIALKIDIYLSRLLSGKPTTTDNLTIEDVIQFSKHFPDYFTKIDIEWNFRSKTFLNLATKLYEKENILAPLEKDVSTDKRAHHLIKHTNYSLFVSEFRKNLHQLTSALNESMQAELKPQSPGYFNSGLPYPELEDANATLQQCEQVLALKRIFNSLFHVEGVIKELENLNNKHSESRYVYHLLQGYGHINDIMTLTKALYADPYFRLIGRELFDKAQNMWAKIQEHTEAYQATHEAVKDDQIVKINSLWYVLNAFYISPKHIRTIRNTNYTTTKELDELHRNAKLSTVRIEAIINSSNSYFKLFLQIPQMYALYVDLTNKLNEFTSTSHDAVMNNLNRIKANIFTPMLIEADRWEDKLGLKPGTLSGPIKEIIDEFFKGFLNPLGLNSKTHIELFCDDHTQQKRLERTRRKIDNAETQFRKTEKKYALLQALDSAVEQYLYITDENYPGTEEQIKTAKEDLILQYKKTLPKLVLLHKKVTVEPSTVEADLNLDDILNSSTNEYDHKFDNIRALVKGCKSYYEGIRATYQMRIKISQEKLDYLTQLGTKQKTDNLLFIEKYTESSFDKQMEAYVNRHLGLQFVHNEYRKKLSEYLLQFKDPIILASKGSDDINLSVKNFIEDHIKTFEKNNFATYYQLDMIRAAIAQFTLYFSVQNTAVQNGSSTFESKKTLDLKTKLINRLNDVAETGQLPIKELIIQITGSKKSEADKEYLIENLNKYSESGHLRIEEVISHIKLSSNDDLYKENEIKFLNSLAERAKLNLQERIDYITTQVEPAQFKGIILSHTQPDFFSLAFLKQCWFALLEALHLYTPERKKLFNKITDAVNQKPEIGELTTRFGLFATTPAPIKEYEPPTPPSAAMSA